MTFCRISNAVLVRRRLPDPGQVLGSFFLPPLALLAAFDWDSFAVWKAVLDVVDILVVFVPNSVGSGWMLS